MSSEKIETTTQHLTAAASAFGDFHSTAEIHDNFPGDFREFVKQVEEDHKELLNNKKVVFSNDKESKDDKHLECKQNGNNEGNRFSFESEENLTRCPQNRTFLTSLHRR